MPEGVAVVVDADGFATIDFVDQSKRGPGLAALCETGATTLIEKDTRSGPRVLYTVPEDNARAAGLLDEVSQVEALEKPDTSSATDASGSVPPPFPSATDLFSTDVRTGSYANQFNEGGVVSGGVKAVTVAPEQVLSAPFPTAFVDSDGVETPVAEGETVIFTDTGGPYEILPEVDSPEGSTPLQPITAPAAPAEAPSNYDDGVPDEDWSRPAVNEYAAKIGITDPEKVKNKTILLAAIHARLTELAAPKND